MRRLVSNYFRVHAHYEVIVSRIQRVKDVPVSIPDVCISRNPRDAPCVVQPREIMREGGFGFKSHGTNPKETTNLTGTVNSFE